jgi:hypothetical protein
MVVRMAEGVATFRARLSLARLEARLSSKCAEEVGGPGEGREGREGLGWET